MWYETKINDQIRCAGLRIASVPLKSNKQYEEALMLLRLLGLSKKGWLLDNDNQMMLT